VSTPTATANESAEAYDLARPEAASLIESLRAFGYELPTALADLVDNSVTAEAKKVWIDFYWSGAESVIAVTDDGKGMSVDRLVDAMRPGSQSPLETRDPGDLGRFGLGLKTASFSQCRSLSVRTRTQSSDNATRRWDLDHVATVNEWQLLRAADALAEPHFRRLADLPSGTAIVWQKLDRLVGGNDAANEKQQQRFLQRAQTVRSHLGMVFHRLIGTNGVEIHLNGHSIRAWDPFLEHEAATQRLFTTPLRHRGKEITVQPFVLPHHSKISKDVHEAAGGPRGWNAHQGFFVYRNKRLIVPGDWLGLGWAKEEHYKLARIRVDIPNALDLDWDIDVTKSKAAPPNALRDDLRHIAERARSDAKRIYTHRGARLSPTPEIERTFLWQSMAKHDKTFYRINREHPLVKQASIACQDRGTYNALLRLIEETVPLPLITITNSEHPNTLPGPFERSPESQIVEVMQQTYRSLVTSGYGADDALNRMRTIWPFELFPALLETLKEVPPHA
jgi:hypothetical protein